MILQLNPTIDVNTPLGDGEAMFIIDYGINVNTVWIVRFNGGKILHIYSDDIRVWGNPINGNGWDTEKCDDESRVEKLPKGLRRKMDFKIKK